MPAYYRQPFHAYEPGNLCWEAAWEAEVAGRAVGARNYPAFGADGEEAFRGAFDDALVAAGARAPGPGETILDLGCATGHGTRRLAAKFPDAKALVGVDLSPYMLAAVWKSTSASGARQFFTKSFLGDDAAVLARSSGEEPSLRADKELRRENAVVVLLRYVCASDVYVRALLEDSFWSG